MTLLEVSDLRVKFYTEEGVVNAVDGLSYQIDRGEKFGVVGESGAGKSVTALSLMRLVESPGWIERGSIRFHDDDTVETFEASFPEHTVDLDELRARYDLFDLAERLEDRGVTGSAVTGQDAHADVAVSDLAGSGLFGIGDLVGKGFAAELGIVGRDDFIVTDGSKRYLEVLRAPEPAVRKLRGNHMAMVFQDAQTALNPVYTVGEQIAEAIRHHLGYDKDAARDRTIQLLDTVGIPEAETRYSDYPHEFSGGMQQRAIIAMALSCDPDLLICDEPTTALDVTIEAKILTELEQLAAEFDTAIQLITHDLGVIAKTCDRVMVMYGGKPVEKASAEALFYDPKHPYTVGLMSSIPRVGTTLERLQTIPGTMPDLVELPPGCSFHPRCPFAEEACTLSEPPLLDPETGEEVYDPSAERAAACLEYAGALEHGLDYEIRVRGADTDTEPTHVTGDHGD